MKYDEFVLILDSLYKIQTEIRNAQELLGGTAAVQNDTVDNAIYGLEDRHPRLMDRYWDSKSKHFLAECKALYEETAITELNEFLPPNPIEQYADNLESITSSMQGNTYYYD
jgi:hypothetical protein